MNRIQCAIEAFKDFRKCDYTVEYSDDAKHSHLETGKLLTADEHSKMSEIDFKEHFSSRDKLIQWYFSYLSNMNKLSVLAEVGNALKSTGGVLVSFGSGPSVLEYFLKLMLWDKVQILCTDYDCFIVKNARRLFPEMEFCVFDFYAGDYEAIKRFGADTALLIGSGCSMDNARYIQFLTKLKEIGISKVFSFEAAVFSNSQWLYHLIRNMAKTIIRGEKAHHSYHAYRRTVYELEKIYTEAGFKYERLKGHKVYPHAYFIYYST